MNKILFLLIIIFTVYFSLLADELNLKELEKTGRQAYKEGKWIIALKNLYAFQIINQKKLTINEMNNLETAIVYCESQLLERPNNNKGIYIEPNGTPHLIEPNGSGVISSNGSFTPIRPGSGGTLIIHDDAKIIELDQKSPIYIDIYGKINIIDNASALFFQDVLNAKTILPYMEYKEGINTIRNDYIPQMTEQNNIPGN